MLVDLWAHRFADDPKLGDQIVNDDFEADLAEFEREAADWEPVVNDTYGP
jgi:hypothetical protein